MESGYALTPRDDDERALSVHEDGAGRGDGASLTRALARRYGDRITGHFTLPGRDGDYAPIPDDVPPALRRALAARGIDRLYRHQAEAWEAAQRGEHVAIVTPTASGKSLCYTLPGLAAALTGRANARCCHGPSTSTSANAPAVSGNSAPVT